MRHELDILCQRLFGKKSERVDPRQLTLALEQLQNERGLVTEQVDGQNGRIKLRGEVWSARTYDPHVVIEAGRNVEVVQIDGATAIVYESEL